MSNHGKGMFNSTFGFLMASIGSAVGLGNLWGFPYKMGMGGGFAFLLIYVILAIFVGYPLILGEMALGRKTGRAAIESFEIADKRFSIAGWFETIVPFLLLCFYCTFGGYVVKYLVANVKTLFEADTIRAANTGKYFEGFVGSGAPAILFGVLFLALTLLVVLGGVEGGIEKFAKIAIPSLFVMLVIVVIRACTLPGASEGLAFMFSPKNLPDSTKGWLNVLGTAGSQMFFSLSIASGASIAFGSYLDKSSNMEQNACIIPVADTIVAILAGMAVMPAVFAAGIEPSGGPGLLFVSLQSVFNGMGDVAGPIFGSIFYLLVFFAALSSSIAMMEGGISSMLDWFRSKGKEPHRVLCSLIMAAIALAGSTLVSADALGSSGFWHPFGQDTWLDVFDLLSEGILMPLGGLLMAIMLGWTRRHYLDDEIMIGSSFKSKKFFDICIRYISPIFMIFIIFVQLNTFFGFIKF